MTIEDIERNERVEREAPITGEDRYYVAVIGAGPAGLFAARQLADRNIHTILFNRDIKPGGLAEYGIYPDKIRMKEGLRNQFRQILGLNEIEYYGNVLVGENADFTLEQLKAMGFQAMLVTVGAQSTKRLGIPGEDLPGVYHAKDIVYHYNLLPPFSESTYQIGKRIAVIGVGNVMMDISRWLIEDKGAEEVIAVARRGPGEVKFDKKELESLVGYLDMDALQVELERVRPVMEAVGQNPEDFLLLMRQTLLKAKAQALKSAEAKLRPMVKDARFRMRFLSSPARVVSDDQGQVAGLDVEQNLLIHGEDGENRAKGTGVREVLPVDTVIFAIGDVVDSAIGLPMQYGEYVKNPQPRFPVEAITYEAFDPQTNHPIEDIFLAGWARRPSTGLVGIARKDATNAAQAVIQYLQTVPPTRAPVAERVRKCLEHLKHPVVDKQDLLRLEMLERERAQTLSVETFKYSSNREMLEVLGLIEKR